ncbi:MAG TPA: TIGR00725 family protein [Conexibacter sp.]
MRDRPHIAVIGPAAPSPEEAARAFEVGELLARAGAVIVCGGGSGVMEEACRGAKAAAPKKTVTIGILPGTDRSASNPFVDVAIPTGLGELRNGLVVRAADALIAVGGAFGTLSEIAFALKAGKRVVGLGTWELSRAGETDATILVAHDPADAVAFALAAP